MKIVHIVPGSGGTFYCQNCLRDEALVRELRNRGHDVILLPMYLPMFRDDPNTTADAPVFYGAINLYLAQKFPFLRKSPAWLRQLLDAQPLLRWAAKRSGSTKAAGLEEMTISMLRGEDGNQAEELDALVAWLSKEEQLDAIHLSNALLLGLTRRLKEEVGVPILCSLQDEDVWVNAMDDDARRTVWATMAEKARNVDAFIAVSDYYGQLMVKQLSIPDEKLHVVHVGLDVDGYQPAAKQPDPPVIGFLSRLSEALGLDILVDTFIELKREPDMANLKLRATGGATGDDHRFLRAVRRRLRRLGLDDVVDFQPNFGRRERMQFLQGLYLLCVPIPGGEAFGTFQIEALATGVPVVQPDAGAFPEIVRETGGGIIYDPDAPNGLKDALLQLLRHPEQRHALGQRGREAVLDRFTIGSMADRVLHVYEACCGPASEGDAPPPEPSRENTCPD